MTGDEFRKSRGMVDSSNPNGNSPNGSTESQQENALENTGNENKLNFADMSKAEILKFAGKRKLYDKSFKELEQGAIIQALLEKAKAKVVEAGLKTAEEIAAVGEDELFALFDSIGK
jgi:hypothetical protein